MKCFHCGSTAITDGARCGSCGRSRGPARVAASVLTPVPYPPSPDSRDGRDASLPEDDATRLVTPDDVTRFVAPASVKPAHDVVSIDLDTPPIAFGGSDDATRLVVPDDVTRLVVPSPLAGGKTDLAANANDAVTRFVATDDATRLVVPEDARRFAPPAAPLGATADDVMRLMSAAEAARAAAADVTRLVSLVEATRVTDDPARLLSPSDAPRAHTDEFTRLVSAAAAARHAAEDATRIVDEYLTRVGAGPAGNRSSSASQENAGQQGDGPLAIGQNFGRYHIIRVLGIGGMGAVYHAWDAELGATVALKVIRPEATRDPGVARELERRFKQELVLARKVTHKNVVRIHDLGEIHGIKFISMPYLEGDDLATVLQNRDTLPAPEALRIVRDVAEGLVAAHEAGIVHRDLKPANIMILEDLAIIMDFGIARSTAVAETPGRGLPSGMAFRGAVSAEATMAGTVVGTMSYMAPEQARGQAVDQRADIYALGLIFADMLVGKARRTGGAKPLDELKRRLEQAPPRVRELNPDIPEAVDDFIARCVQPDADARFQTTKEMVEALERIDAEGNLIRVRKVIGLPYATAVTLALLMAIGGVWWYYQSLIPPPTIPPLQLVIADFDNRTGDASFDRTLEPLLVRGLEEAPFITTHHRSSRTLAVPAPATLNAEAATLLAINHGVGAVVIGAVEREAGGFKVSLRALRPKTQEELASVSRRASNKQDVVPTLAALAKSIRSELGDDTADTRSSSRAVDPLTTTSLEVAKQYALGLDGLSSSGNDKALEAFSRAIQIDPEFGLAYSGLAIASRNLDHQQDAVKYADEAIRHLDGMTPRERLRTRGLQLLVTADYKGCVDQYKLLIDKYPSDAAAYNNLALCATHLRRFKPSLEARDAARKLLPTRSVYSFNLAIDSTYAGEFAKGESEANVARELGSPLGPVALAFAHVALNRLQEARSTLEDLAKGTGTLASRGQAGLAELAAFQGRYADAVRLFEEGAKTDLAAKNSERAADKLAGARLRAVVARSEGRCASGGAAGTRHQPFRENSIPERAHPGRDGRPDWGKESNGGTGGPAPG